MCVPWERMYYVVLQETYVSDRMWKELSEDLYARTYYSFCVAMSAWKRLGSAF